MAELVAVGKNQQRWWQTLPEGETVLLGRAPRNGFPVPWDPLISREHAHVSMVGGKLLVRELPTARNPIFLGGEPVKEFEITPEGEFLIGETTFRFEVRQSPSAHQPKIVEHTLGSSAGQLKFDNANACLQALCQMPTLISSARNDADFAARVVELLLRSLRGATVAAVVQFDSDSDGNDDASQPKLIRWNSRDEVLRRFTPSRKLMARAFEQQQSVVHLWCREQDSDTQYTMTSDLDWAFCTPIPIAGKERWCLYVSGHREFCGIRDVQSPDDLLAELGLAEMMAQFIGAIRQVRVLEHQHTEMLQFFSPAVVETLVSENCSSALEPRQGLVGVLFCDVRGFSRKVEESSDNLRALLDKVGEALSIMTRSILKYEGVIADFQGDAALGFWGWPNPADDAAVAACRTALSIHNAFAEAEEQEDHPLHGFQVGMGVCHGDAIAGRIGSQEQIKVGVFGPVVNLASRLQDLTKQLGVPILMDAATAEIVAATFPATEATCRRVVRLRPCGIATPVDVYALIPRRHRRGQLSAADWEAFDLAVDMVIDGDWRLARTLLSAVPVDDGPANFLRSAIDHYGGHPPADWDGAFTMVKPTGAFERDPARSGIQLAMAGSW